MAARGFPETTAITGAATGDYEMPADQRASAAALGSACAMPRRWPGIVIPVVPVVPVVRRRRPAMIHLYTWNTPNGIKPIIMLEETGIEHRIHPIDISSGAQHDPAFVSINPNGRIPALIDTDRPGDACIDDVRGMRVFESGAVLMYLAQRAKAFLPTDPVRQAEVTGWMFWQVGGLGPMVGQLHWFNKNLPDDTAGVARYRDETARLLDVLDRRLTGRAFLVDDYSIADMMCWAWAKSGVDGVGGKRAALDAWLARVSERPAVQRAKAVAEAMSGRT